MSVVHAFLLLSTLFAPQDASTPVELPERITFEADDSMREEGFQLEVPVDGVLHVYALADRGSPSLLIFDGSNEHIDANPGGGSTAYLAVVVEPGQFVDVLVSAAADGAPCVVRLGASYSIETAETAALSAHIQGQLDRIDPNADDAALRFRALAERLPTEAGAISPSLRALAERFTTLPRQVRMLETEAAARGLLHAHAVAHLPPGHPTRVDAAAYFAAALKNVGRLEEALEIEQALLERARAVFGDGDRSVQIARLNLAGTLFLMEDLDAAANEFGALYEALRDVTPAGDVVLSAARQNLAAVEMLRGYVGRAAALYEAEIDALTRTVNGLARATAEVDYGACLLELGQAAEAEAVLATALQTLRAELPPEDPEIAACEKNHALALAQLGDLDAARLIYEQVYARQAAAYPAEHPEVTQAKQTLANLLVEMDETEAARAMLAEVVAAHEDAGTSTQRDALYAQLSLAIALMKLGRMEEAVTIHEALAERIPEAFPDTNILALSAVDGLAGAHSELGHLDTSRALQGENLARALTVFPPTDLLVLRARNNLAWTLVRQGDVEGTALQIRASTKALLERLARLAPDRSAREIEALVRRSRTDVDQALSIVAALPEGEVRTRLEGQLFGLVEVVRTIGLTQRRARNLLAELPDDAEVQAAVEAVRAAEVEVVRALRGGEGDALAAVRRRDAAQRELRSALRTASPEADRELSRIQAVDPNELGASLEPGVVAVGFWRYEFEDIDRATQRLMAPVDHYLAYVVGAEGLARVELGPASVIDDAIDHWRELALRDWTRAAVVEDSDETVAAREAGEALRKLLIDPLRKSLGDAQRIRCAPDDALYLVPFDALPDPAGKPLGDTWRFVYRPGLTRTERELAPTDEPTLLAMGGIEYDMDPKREEGTTRAFRSTSDALPTQVLRSAAWQPGFSYLPDSESEVRALAHSYGITFEDAPAIVLTGREASRASFEALAPSARYLHLATHAFFAPESIPSMIDDDGRAGFAMLDARAQARGFAPMLLCGLAFAGANRVGEDDADLANLMTAEELAALDLSECELAVLSACETSLGVRRAGQGVASLQSALYAAGVRASVTSLWRVPDAATKELMQHFYRALWIEGLPKADALWRAKQRLRDRRDAQGRPIYTVRDWGAWVLAGDA